MSGCSDNIFGINLVFLLALTFTISACQAQFTLHHFRTGDRSAEQSGAGCQDGTPKPKN